MDQRRPWLQQLWNRGRYYRPDDRDAEDARFASGPITFGPSESRVSASTRLLGISWTEFAEGYDASMKPKMSDASTVPPTDLRPGDSVADLGIEIEGAWNGPYRNSAFSPTHGTSGRPLAVDGSLRYTAKLKTGIGTRRCRSPVTGARRRHAFLRRRGSKFLG
jgi:hypothetical protein